MFSLISCASFSIAKDPNKINEDSVLLPISLHHGYICAVADGVGSYKGAKEASKLVTDFLMTLKNDKVESHFNIDSIFNSIKDKIDNLSNVNSDFQEAATTLTFYYIDNLGIHIGHIGDSRLYIKNNSKLIQVTKDHTRHQQLLDAQLYTAKQLKKISGKNILTTALSSKIEMKYDKYFLSIEDLKKFSDDENCILINLMSDGAYNIWEKRPVFSQKTLNSPSAFCNSLLRRVERIGAEDDHSLISVKIKI